MIPVIAMQGTTINNIGQAYFTSCRKNFSIVVDLTAKCGARTELGHHAIDRTIFQLKINADELEVGNT